jgi:hypothetical protein
VYKSITIVACLVIALFSYANDANAFSKNGSVYFENTNIQEQALVLTTIQARNMEVSGQACVVDAPRAPWPWSG